MKCTLLNIEPTLKGYEILLLVGREHYEPIKKSDYYTLDLKPYFPGRTRDQENYYRARVREIAELIGSTPAEVHNHMLRWYGCYETDADGNILMIRRYDNDSYLVDEDIHLEPTDETEVVDGCVYRWFRVLKSVSAMTTQEMTRLINGIKQEMENLND